MANIYLNFRKDKKMFAQCYRWQYSIFLSDLVDLIIREVVEKSPSPQSYLLLGDAYMSITEPERALEIYEQVTFDQSEEWYIYTFQMTGSEAKPPG